MTEPAAKPKNVIGTRHRQVFLMFLGLIVVYILRVNLSVGIVAMTDSSANPNFQTVNMTSLEKGSLLSMFFYGYFLTGIPAGILAGRLGPIKLISMAGLVCALTTLLFPLVVLHFGFYGASVLRVIQGLGQGFFYPCVNTHMSKWAVPEERGKMFSGAFSGTQLGTIIMLGTGGFLAAGPGGWPSIFYASGAVAVLWSIACFIYGADSPSSHPSISTDEKNFVENRLQDSSKDSKKMPVPWCSLLTSGPLWALLFLHMCQNWGFWTLLTLIPTYIQQVFKLDIKQNGMLSALPYLAMFITAWVFAVIADLITEHKLLSVNFSRKMWNSIAHYGGAIALIALGLTDPTLTEAIAFLTIAVAVNSGAYNGYLCNHLDLAPNFAGVLMGITNGLANVTSILAPTIAGLLLQDETDVIGWRIVFEISAGVFFIGNTLFIIFGSTRIQKWNNPQPPSKPSLELSGAHS